MKRKIMMRELGSGRTAFFKNKKEADKLSRVYGYKVSKTKHTLRGKGYLVTG